MKSLLIQLVIVFSFFNFVSCNHKQAPLQSTVNAPGGIGDNHPQPPEQNNTIPSYSWNVVGCAAVKDQHSIIPLKQADKFALPKDPKITVDGDSIKYTRSLAHQCCRQVKVSTHQKDSILTLTEYWFRQGCKCQCNSTVSAVLKKLAKGNYRLFIIETGTDPFDDKPTQLKDTIWSQKITIR